MIVRMTSPGSTRWRKALWWLVGAIFAACIGILVSPLQDPVTSLYTSVSQGISELRRPGSWHLQASDMQLIGDAKEYPVAKGVIVDAISSTSPRWQGLTCLIPNFVIIGSMWTCSSSVARVM